MKFTITLKVLYPDGGEDWGARFIVEDEFPDVAISRAFDSFKKIEINKNNEIIDYRVDCYKPGDENTLVRDKRRWELEEERENAPALIARALNRIANNMFDLRPLPITIHSEKIDPFAFAALIFSSISVITSVILILIFR